MSFLQLNGIDVPVSHDSASLERLAIGAKDRAFDGTLRSSVRARKRQWRLRTTQLDAVTANAVSGLIEGRGHHWSFDSDLYSDKGLGPISGSGSGASIGGTSPTPKFGAGRLRLAASNGITFPTALGEFWTVTVWHWDGSAWHHHYNDWNGDEYIDGDSAGGMPSWLQVDLSGNVTLVAGAGGPEYFDDLVCLPYRVPSGWIPQLYRNEAFSALPRLHLDSYLTPDGRVVVEGDVGGVQYLQARVAGFWNVNAQTVEFSLSEV